ncbi:MAG: RHS repeat-associated core domain-containing protein [Bacteroidales bacterium]|nr:RHS repeat-associated core domain-containing protein [Bacteroidales bacterium]
MARIKQVFTVLASLSAGLILSAQELPVYSVTCPEASGLGEYGEVPVSHFTGIPNISVPLYEIRYGDYTIPVTADYHLASVRPGTPPGSLGIGWTLQAGGVISRTVRGVYDEKKASTGSGNGFYWNTAGLKSVSTDGFGCFAEQTRDFLQSETPEGWHELSADEFSFSFLGYSGNFYINEDGGWSVVSDSDIKVEFNPMTGFAGNPISRHIEHRPASNSEEDRSSYDGILTESIYCTYDKQQRLLTEHHSLNGNSPVLLLSNAYDNIGRLSNVQRGNSSSLAESMTYNIRSWLLTSSSELFSQKLYYNIPRTGSSAPCYNGFVSSFEWKSRGDAFTRAYDYGYDAYGRLATAAYNALTYDDYSTSYAYDVQNNLTAITRNCTDSRHTAYLDRLRLTYDGNQLRKVTDATMASSPDTTGFNDGSDEFIEYEYNFNGNLTKDMNRSIDKITYDIANQPATIQSDSAQISFDYLAFGSKLRQTVATANDTVVTTYQGGLVRQNGKIKYLLTDGGYIDFSSNHPVYMFYLKDYLGNNRVVVSSSGHVAQVNNYYPYGVSFPTNRQSSPLEPGFPGVPSLPEQGTADDNSLQTAAVKDALTQGGAIKDSLTIGGGVITPADSLQASLTDKNQPWRFSGNELLEGGPVRLYDFIARTYDQALGCFLTPDPLAEKYYSVSPYAYCSGNPVNFVDPDGERLLDKNGIVITYTKKDGWSENVTDEQKNYLVMLQRTQSGAKLVEDIINTDIDVTIEFTDEVLKNSNEQTKSGQNTTITNNGKPIKSEVLLSRTGIKENHEISEKYKNVPLFFYQAMMLAHELQHTFNVSGFDKTEDREKDSNSKMEEYLHEAWLPQIDRSWMPRYL